MMKHNNNKTIKLVTHDGSFHADDIFAYAVLQLLLDVQEEKYEIIRTRDQDVINAGDYVFDVGGVYDPATNRFDHHQQGGAGKRSNGIEYASFGLVWKKFGIELGGEQKVADMVDERLVTPIDAGDNGQSIFEPTGTAMPFLVQSVFNSFIPGWKNTNDATLLSGFLECVEIAKKILTNEIKKVKDVLEVEDIISTIYNNTEDKRIIVLDKKYPWKEAIQNYPEPIFVVYPRVDGKWGAEGVAVKEFSIEKRKNLPSAWAGLRDEELQRISGVSDAIFCHRALFVAVSKSKEGAIKLAQIAVES